MTCDHRGDKIRAGPYEVLVGGTRYMKVGDLRKADVVVPLIERRLSKRIRERFNILPYPWPDFRPPPEGFKQFLEEKIVPLLHEGKKVLVFCVGGHGRTGTFLASLIALIESVAETPDPIAAVRERHCSHAVETLEQVAAVFALRGQAVPEIYKPRKKLEVVR